jgi:hypothetical protein
MQKSTYKKSVFINCPFDPTYDKLFNAIVFTIYACGYSPKCAKETADSRKIRIEVIIKIIADCQFGIHDLSYAKPDPITKLARFNMPLELGLFYGAQYYGAKKQTKKVCLVVDKKEYQYRNSISDLSGHDIEAHENNPRKLITIIRNWLQHHTQKKLPLVDSIKLDYKAFLRKAPKLHSTIHNNNGSHRPVFTKIPEMPYIDFIAVVEEWLKDKMSS